MTLLASLLLSAGVLAFAGEEPLVCFGNEPSWALDLAVPGQGTFSTPGSEPVTFEGSASPLFLRQESIWRGTHSRDTLVAFLRAQECSDTMSDTVHPYTSSVSTPDGRHLEGCCRKVGAQANDRGLGDATWQLVADWVPAGTEAVTVSFDVGRVQGFSGCNQFSGSYTVDGQTNRLQLGNMAATMMACPGPAMGVEQRFFKAFTGEMAVSVSGDRLTLSPQSDGEVLEFTAAPQPKITGVDWEVTGYNNGRQAVVSPVVGSAVTLRFEDGKVLGDTGCNPFFGSFTLEGDRIHISGLGSGRKLCEPELMDQERAFLSALEGAGTWKLWRGMLHMHLGDGSRALTASTSGKGK